VTPEDRAAYQAEVHAVYRLHRDQIHAEDAVINHRVSWLVASQAFLLGTYVFLVNDPARHIVQTGTVAYSDTLTFNATAMTEALRLLRYLFSIAGCVMSVGVACGVWAAIGAMGDVLKNFKDHTESIDTYWADRVDTETMGRIRDAVPSLICRTRWRFMGGLPAMFAGPLFASCWLTLFFHQLGGDVGIGIAVGGLLVIVVMNLKQFSTRNPYPLH
jgi:hypothetical protein